MNNIRALNDYTANLPQKQQIKNFKEPKKVLNSPSTGSPMETRQKKKTNYIVNNK